MKKGVIVFFFLGLIVAIAAFSNPEESRHKEVLTQKIKAHLDARLEKERENGENPFGKIGQAFGAAFGKLIVENAVDQIVFTENYVVFSLTKVEWDGKPETIGFGIFGNVLFTKSLDRILEESFNDL